MSFTLARISVLGLAAVALLSAGPRVRLGGVMVSGGYSSGWGPGWYSPYWGGPMWRYYDPFWYGPAFHPGYFTGYSQGPGLGEVKLTSTSSDAVVLIDGAYAGEAKKLKSMWLEPGVYNIEVRHDTAGSFEKKIYVLSGKTLELRAQLTPKQEKPK